MSKLISRLLWFWIFTLCDWLTKLAPLSQPIGSQTKINRVLAVRVFPALGASYMYFLRILIGSLCCLHLLRLAGVITLVLVLRHSIGNRSIKDIFLTQEIKRTRQAKLDCFQVLTSNYIGPTYNNVGRAVKRNQNT